MQNDAKGGSDSWVSESDDSFSLRAAAEAAADLARGRAPEAVSSDDGSSSLRWTLTFSPSSTPRKIDDHGRIPGGAAEPSAETPDVGSADDRLLGFQGGSGGETIYACDQDPDTGKRRPIRITVYPLEFMQRKHVLTTYCLLGSLCVFTLLSIAYDFYITVLSTTVSGPLAATTAAENSASAVDVVPTSIICQPFQHGAPIKSFCYRGVCVPLTVMRLAFEHQKKVLQHQRGSHVSAVESASPAWYRERDLLQSVPLSVWAQYYDLQDTQPFGKLLLLFSVQLLELAFHKIASQLRMSIATTIKRFLLAIALVLHAWIVFQQLPFILGDPLPLQPSAEDVCAIFARRACRTVAAWADFWQSVGMDVKSRILTATNQLRETQGRFAGRWSFLLSQAHDGASELPAGDETSKFGSKHRRNDPPAWRPPTPRLLDKGREGHLRRGHVARKKKFTGQSEHHSTLNQFENCDK